MGEIREYTSRVVVEGLVFPEAPRWRDGYLYFSDQHARRVCRVDPAGELATVAEVPEHPSGLGWLPDGTLLVVSMYDRRVLRVDATGGIDLHADLAAVAEFHCNDMVVDATGRAYVGNFGFDLDGGASPRSATIAIVEPDGAVRAGPGDLAFPNGMVITPDGGTLIVSESAAGRLTAFTVGADGDLTERREFAVLEGAVSDGICLDAAGAVWSACPLTGRVLRVEPGGNVTDVVTPAHRKTFACMLGGDDRRDLYICAAPTFVPDDAVAARDGAIEVVRVQVPGAGLP